MDKYRKIDLPKESEKEIFKIFEMAQARLREDGIVIPEPEIFGPISRRLFDSIIEVLKEADEDTLINFWDIIRFYKTRSTSEDGEKEGNIVPGCELGEKFKLGVKNDDDTEEDEE